MAGGGLLQRLDTGVTGVGTCYADLCMHACSLARSRTVLRRKNQPTNQSTLTALLSALYYTLLLIMTKVLDSIFFNRVGVFGRLGTWVIVFQDCKALT